MNTSLQFNNRSPPEYDKVEQLKARHKKRFLFFLVPVHFVHFPQMVFCTNMNKKLIHLFYQRVNRNRPLQERIRGNTKFLRWQSSNRIPELKFCQTK